MDNDVIKVRGKIRNKYTDEDLEKDIRSYVEKCFKDACESEQRPYKDTWSFEYLIVNHNGKDDYHLIPFISCKYNRVLRRVNYRLEKNMEKNFGIYYGRSDLIRFLTYEDQCIDPNHTECMIKYGKKTISVSLFDVDYADEMKGEVIGAGRYEKLILTHFGWSIDEFRSAYEKVRPDGTITLPDNLLSYKGWDEFKELYKKTFNEDVGSRFHIICSSGIERM